MATPHESYGELHRHGAENIFYNKFISNVSYNEEMLIIDMSHVHVK